MSNFIKIDRKILEWEWYKNMNTCRLFFHLLIKANWKDKKFEGMIIKRGQLVSSYRLLSAETGLTMQELRTAVEHLKSTGEITVKTHGKFSVFTVNNYCLYQADQHTDNIQPTSNQQATNKQSTSNQQAINKQSTTTEEVKKERSKEYNINTMCKSEAFALFEQLWKLYPVKKGKGQVSETKRMKIASIGFDEMSRAIDRYIKYVDSVDYLHYQNGSTFFNSGYVDYLDANYEETKHDVKKKATGKAAPFPQREYDMDSLERQLLGKT